MKSFKETKEFLQKCFTENKTIPTSSLHKIAKENDLLWRTVTKAKQELDIKAVRINKTWHWTIEDMGNAVPEVEQETKGVDEKYLRYYLVYEIVLAKRIRVPEIKNKVIENEYDWNIAKDILTMMVAEGVIEQKQEGSKIYIEVVK